MNIINNNPYRFLGVFSNSSTKERVANKGKMNAFLKVRRQVSFPLDLPNLLPPIERNMDSVADAESKLTLPADQIKYALFWWMKASPLDDIAFNHLFDGNVDMAQSIWQKKDDVSSLQNRIVLAMIQGDYHTAVHCAEILYSRFSDDFTTKVVGDSLALDAPLWQLFFDTLFDADVNAQLLTDNITISDWKEYVGQKTISPLIDSITSTITAAKASRGKGSSARLKAGQKLMAETKTALAQLKKLIPSTDIRYQTVADKLATEILQCGIDYYNDSEEADAVHKAMKLQSYALNIAVGSMTKDRCKENVDILKDIIANLPPIEVFTEDNAIKEELRKYCQLPDKICHAVTLLNNTKPHLQAIKVKLSATNMYYLKLSTQVVANALHNIIEEVNDAQKDDMIELGGKQVPISMILDRDAKIAKIKSALQAAWNATKIMDTFDMEVDFKSKRYNENRSTLKSLCEQLGISTYTTVSNSANVKSQQSTTSSEKVNHLTDNGCFIAFVIWLVLGCVFGGICVAMNGDFICGFFISGFIIALFSQS